MEREIYLLVSDPERPLVARLTRAGIEKLCNDLCTCAYLLPCKTALDTGAHPATCPYRATMDQIHASGLTAILTGENAQ